MRVVKPKSFHMSFYDWLFTLGAVLLDMFMLCGIVYSIDCCKYIADINNGDVCYYSGVPLVVDTYSPQSRAKGSSVYDVKIQLENGDWIEIEYKVLRNNGISQTEVLSEKSWDIYYTQYSSDNARINNDKQYHQIVSIATDGYNEQMAEDIKRELGTTIFLVVVALPLLILGSIFCSTPIAMELRKCFETKKEQEKREKKEKRSAERRTKYLEERVRLREEKQKKKH